ncbi:MAG: Bcr/CflA family efflux MFS transporter [Streptosporangiales bacterium]|nr:Bcr/CflA family efflux MFS transporter [Streptosporangiales bacterium]
MPDASSAVPAGRTRPRHPRFASPSRRPRAARTVLLGALTAIGPLSLDMYLPGLPAVAQDLRAAESQVQLSLTACLIGMAAGQLLIGPLSDQWGRKRLLVGGLAAYAIASLLCALAPSATALIALRLLQGVAGGAGVVIARAIVRDEHSGATAALYFARLTLVTGLAPILAPMLGGQVLRVTGWHGIFVLLGVFGVLITAWSAAGLPETLAPERRAQTGLGNTLRTMLTLLKDRVFLGYVLGMGLAFSGMFAYISGSPFVIQEVYGATPQEYSLLFGGNALALVIVGQVAGRLAGRFPMRRMLRIGLSVAALSSVALLVAAYADSPVAVIAALFVFVASLGSIMPTTMGLALDRHPEAAGTASALMGVLQFGLAGAAAPVVGLLGGTGAVPMATVIAAAAVSGLVAMTALTWGAGRAAHPARA